MKKIFIATDFTPASQDAALYAIELAKLFHAKVYLFHAYQYPAISTGGYLATNTIDLHKSAKEWLRAQAELINADGKVHLEMFSEEGPAIETILKNAREKNADIIICGMKGKAKMYKKIFGSVAYSLINKSDIPILIIPEKLAFKKPHHIALAVDMDPETSPATLHLLSKLGETLFSKVSVINALSEGYDEKDITKFHPPVNIEAIKHLYPAFQFCVGNNIPKTVEWFAKEKKIDMLAIIPHKHSLVDRLFNESVTKKLVYYTSLPVLALPQKKIESDDVEGNFHKIKEIWEDEIVKRDAYHG